MSVPQNKLPDELQRIADKFKDLPDPGPMPCRRCKKPIVKDEHEPWEYDTCHACGLEEAQERCGIEQRYKGARLLDFPPAYRELAERLMVQSGYIWGEPGNGKTHTIAAIATAILERDHGRGVLFLTWRKFKREWRASFKRNADQSEDDLMRAWASRPHLFFDDVSDDMGGEDSYALRAVFCDLIDERYSNNRHTVLTSNLDLAGLAQKFTKKVSDRLYEGGKIIRNTLPNRRVG